VKLKLGILDSAAIVLFYFVLLLLQLYLGVAWQHWQGGGETGINQNNPEFPADSYQ
jgi:hypothetical protein